MSILKDNTQKIPNFATQLADFDKRLESKSIEKVSGRLYIPGSEKILISAPHGVEQTRLGKIKFAETRTGSIAKYLNTHYQTPALIKTQNLADDANYDENCEYKDFLSTLIPKLKIKALIDLHIMSDKRDYDIDIGTGEGSNLENYDLIPTVILEIFKKNQILNPKIDKFFKAKSKNTVCATISRRCNIPCIQLELNYGLLLESPPSARQKNVLCSLIEIIEYLKTNVDEPQ